MKSPTPREPDERALGLGLGRRDLVVLLALTVPVLVLFADPIFTGRVFYFRDVARFFYPNYHYVAERLRQGRLPLWNPYCFCGHPFLGSWYPGALYPLIWIMVLFPLPHSLTAFVLVHSYLALGTMYLLARGLGCNRPAATVSALTFGLSGFALSLADFPNSLAGLAWMPLVFMLVRRSLCRPSLGRVAGAAVVIALQALAGGPEMVYLTWLVTGLYGVTKLLSGRRAESGGPARRRRLAALAGCFALGALLAAAQLVPFLEVLGHSTRGRGVGLMASSAWPVPPRDLARFLVPDLLTRRLPFGLKWTSQVWLKSFYLGLLPWVLTAIALVRVRQRRTIFLAGLAALGMILACGERTLLWVLAYYALPGLSGTRFPAKFMLIPTFSVAILAGLGANWLMLADDRRRRRTLLGAAIIVLMALTAVGVVKPSVDRVPIEAYRNTARSLVRTGVVLAGMAVCLGGLAGLSRWQSRHRPWALRALAAALGLVLVADTYHHHRPQVLTAHPRMYRTRPTSMDLIDRLPQPSRIFFWFRASVFRALDIASPSAVGEGDPLALLREIHIRNLPMLNKVQSVHGFVPIRPWQFDRLYRRLKERYAAHSLPLVDFLNARLVIYAREDGEEPSLDALRFEVNRRALPRATIVRRRVRRTFADDGALVDWLTGREFNPRQEVHLERESAPPAVDLRLSATRDRVEIVRYEPERIVIHVESTAPGYLVVADQFFPGWQATLGGRRAEIVRANFCFRAVAIPEGIYTVEMVYRPWTVRAGMALCGITAVLLAALVIRGRFFRPGRAGPPLPAVPTPVSRRR